MSIERAAESQAEAWFVKLIERKLQEQYTQERRLEEVDAQFLRDFGYPRGPCKPRDLQR